MVKEAIENLGAKASYQAIKEMEKNEGTWV
jgi:hypothetical protein